MPHPLQPWLIKHLYFQGDIELGCGLAPFSKTNKLAIRSQPMCSVLPIGCTKIVYELWTKLCLSPANRTVGFDYMNVV
jgi:hypothetical protein